MWAERSTITIIASVDIIYNLITVLFLNIGNLLGVDVSMSILNYDQSLDTGILRCLVIVINVVYLRQLHLAWKLLITTQNSAEQILETFKHWRLWSMLVFVCVILEFHSTALSFLRGHGGKISLVFMTCKVLELVLRSSGIHYFDTFKSKVRSNSTILTHSQ